MHTIARLHADMLQIACCNLQAAGCMLQVARCNLHAAGGMNFYACCQTASFLAFICFCIRLITCLLVCVQFKAKHNGQKPVSGNFKAMMERKELEIPSDIDTAAKARSYFDEQIKNDLPQRPWVFDKATPKQIAKIKTLDPTVSSSHAHSCSSALSDMHM